MIFKAYKYRLYPNANQRELIDKTLGCCRLVYNLALETKNTAYRLGTKLNSYALCYQLTDLKKDFDWMNEVDSQALQASIKTIDKAFGNYFRMLKDGTIEQMKSAYIKNRQKKGLMINYGKLANMGRPKFKSKKDAFSFSCPNNKREINWEKSTLTVPKIKDIPIVLCRKFDGEIKTVTISKTSTGKYFASVLVEQGGQHLVKKVPTIKTSIGIDVGLTHYATLSDDRKIENPRHLRNAIHRVKVLSRRATRKQKASSNQKKAYYRLALAHERVTNRRNDFLHKLSYRLVNDSQVDLICVEGLAVKNMVQNHKLAQSISDAAWGTFFSFLKYKSEWYGKNYVAIGTFDKSTSECSECHHQLESAIPLMVREWTCPKCNAHHDRDENAAVVIKQKGFMQFTESLTNSGKPLPVEPVESRTKVRAKKQEVPVV